MAKKNSSKTATEKAISASEPRLITFKGWQGVNFVDAPLTWQPLEDFHQKHDAFNQSNLPDNFLMVQNNVNTTETLSLETRMDSIRVGVLDAKNGTTPLLKIYKWVLDDLVGWKRIYDTFVTQPDVKFTGVSGIYKHWIFHVVRFIDDEETEQWHESILYRSLLDDNEYEWNQITLNIYGHDGYRVEIQEIGFFENNLVATAFDVLNQAGMLLLAEMAEQGPDFIVAGKNWEPGQLGMPDHIGDTPKISPPLGEYDDDRPGVSPSLEAVGMSSGSTASDSHPIRVEVKFCYTNRLGSTLTQRDSDPDSQGRAQCATIYTELSPALWTTKKYVRVTPSAADTVDVTSVTGIDFYARDTENLDWVFVGHIEVSPSDITNHSWVYNWYGNMTDITQWLTAQLMVPTDNTTHGPDATHFSCHDSRMYFWGMPSKPYRLWIGGNPGSEFSVARGLGGAWVDIEPGSGYDVKGTAKWKTTSGANIVTIMCGNMNTTKIKRFNLVETNLTLTNEVAYKSYMYEEVSNVVGCNSRWGYGVYDDGLYSLNRYGLVLSTMASEYNNQMRNQKVSGVIEPIFTNALGSQLSDGRMVCINGVIYIAFSEDDNAMGLGNVFLCYDTALKAWYTWTHDQTLGSSDNDKVLHIFAIDSEEFREGLGAVTETEVRLYPVTGEQGVNIPLFQVLIESGEIAPRQPMQAYWYLQQMEFRFDYFIGLPSFPATILVEGVDYYGRYFQIEKKLNYTKRSWQQYNDNGLVNHIQPVPNGPVFDTVVERRNYTEWIRIDKLVQSVRIRIKGRARFRLTHINAKVYQQADNIGTPYGYDAGDMGYDARGTEFKIHHYIDDYNNLRRAVVS